jgi:hypothetical protein
MATYSKELLSGSTGGRPILVGATSSPGTTIHATGNSTTTVDEVWLYVNNTSGLEGQLTVQFGDTTSPSDHIVVTVPESSGLVLVVPGVPLVGTGSAARTVRAFAGTTNVLNIVGYVNRITP